MANPNPSKRTRFKRGNKANPSGAGAHDPNKKMLRNLTNEQFREISGVILNGNLGQLRALVKAPETSIAIRMFAAVVEKIITKGDMQSLDILLNRLIGKPKVEGEHPSDVATEPQVVIYIPSNGREVDFNGDNSSN